MGEKLPKAGILVSSPYMYVLFCRAKLRKRVNFILNWFIIKIMYFKMN